MKYFVEYIDNLTGIKSSECWSEHTLNEELNRNEVKITFIRAYTDEMLKAED